jgi:hypothetical protein
LGTEASSELLRQDMANRQRSPPLVTDKNEANVFDSTQMDPFVAVSLSFKIF